MINLPGATAAELIAALATMPLEAIVAAYLEGGPRTTVHFVWLARNGGVILTDYNEVIYDDRDRPPSAPTETETPYWSTPPAPPNYDRSTP